MQIQPLAQSVDSWSLLPIPTFLCMGKKTGREDERRKERRQAEPVGPAL
jgi:hypothetical protein